MLLIPCFDSAYQMAYCGFADDSCIHTLNISSAASVLNSQAHDLVSSGAVCIGLATNNIVEYQAVIGLLTEAAYCDIDNLVVFMDSQLVVSHLNHVYVIRNPMLL